MEWGPICRDVFLIANWCKRAQPTMDGTIPRQVDLSCRRKVTTQARRSKPVSNIPPWSLSQLLLPDSWLEFLPWLPLLTDCNLWVKQTISSPTWFWSMSYNSNIEKTRTDTNLRIETQDRILDLKELQNELGCKGWKRQLRMSGWAPRVTLVEFPWSFPFLWKIMESADFTVLTIKSVSFSLHLMSSWV